MSGQPEGHRVSLDGRGVVVLHALDVAEEELGDVLEQLLERGEQRHSVGALAGPLHRDVVVDVHVGLGALLTGRGTEHLRLVLRGRHLSRSDLARGLPHQRPEELGIGDTLPLGRDLNLPPLQRLAQLDATLSTRTVR